MRDRRPETPRLSFHVGGGFLSHALDPERARSPSFLVGLGYVLDEWVRLDVEIMTAAMAETLSCPVLKPVCTPSGESSRLVTLLYGLRIESPTDRLRGFGGVHRGLELDGRYEVFEMLAGGKLYVTGRLAVRVEARHRWDYRFVLRDPVREPPSWWGSISAAWCGEDREIEDRELEDRGGGYGRPFACPCSFP